MLCCKFFKHPENDHFTHSFQTESWEEQPRCRNFAKRSHSLFLLSLQDMVPAQTALPLCLGKVMDPVLPKNTKKVAFPTASDPCRNYIGWIHTHTQKNPQKPKPNWILQRNLFFLCVWRGFTNPRGVSFQWQGIPETSISHCLEHRMWSPKLGSGPGCSFTGLMPRFMTLLQCWQKRWKFHVLPRMGRAGERGWRVLPSSAALRGLGEMKQHSEILIFRLIQASAFSCSAW